MMYDNWVDFLIDLPYNLIQAFLIWLWFYALYIAIFDPPSKDRDDKD
jgi:hypothetical protein